MIIGALVVAFILLALLQRVTAVRGLKSLREDHFFSAATAEPESPLEIGLRFANASRLFLPFVRYDERLPEGARVLAEGEEKRDSRGGAYLMGTTWLKPRQVLEKRIPVCFEKRGRYLLSDFKVFCGDFLGLQEEGRRYAGPRELIVFPREYPGGPWEKTLGSLLGDMSVRRFIFEDPVLTLGFREYSGREPMKMISWTRSAQNKGLMVKQYDYTTDPSVLVILNTEYEGQDKEVLLDTACSLARSVCRYLEDGGIPYAFVMNARMLGTLQKHCFMPSGLGSRHFYTLLENLGRAVPETVCSCPEMLRRSLEGQGAGKGVFLITPARDEIFEQSRRMIQASYGCHLISLIAGEMNAE